MTDKGQCSGNDSLIQQQAGKALQESEQRYRTMIANLPGFVYRCKNDRNWTMTFISDGCRDVTGYAPEDLLNNKKLAFNDIVRPDYRERTWQHVQECLRQKAAFQHEYPIVIASGETDHWVWERGRGIFSDTGELLYIEGFIADITERKQSEEALHIERLLLRTLIDNIPDSIYSKDLAGRKMLANLAEVHYLGAKSEADVLGKDDLAFYPKELAERFLADDQLVMETGQPVLNKEEYIFYGQHEKRWLLTSKLPLRNQEGRVIGLVGVGRDITDRKHAEEATQRERAFFDQLVEKAPEGIAIDEPHGRVVRVNAEFVRMFGYEADEAVGHNIDDLVAPPGREQEARGMTASTSQGETNYLETVRRRKDGTLIDVSIIAMPIIVAGVLEAVCAIYRDITDRKRAEEALRASEVRYHTFIDATSDLVFLKDESFRYVISNEANNSFLGKAGEDVIGHTDFELMPKETAEHCHASDQEALDRGRSLTAEESVGARVYQTTKFPVPLPDGHVGLGCYVRDITDRKQAEEARELAEAQLRQSQKMEAIGTLAGGVAHDFNNLLTGILGNIALMRSSLPTGDPLLENLDAAETAAHQAADLTQGLLTFGRNAMVLPLPTEISGALDVTLAMLKQSLPATIDIIRDYEKTAWNVLLDQSQMTQILLNLAVNARDAMNGKGTLIIRTRNEVITEEYVRVNPFARTGEFVHLSVADTGSGIPPAILEHLFEPFHTTKPPGSGTGLGLSIVYGAVKQAGGWITAVSTEGAGATFDIYLPRCLATPLQPPRLSSHSAGTARGTVLVVEDEPVVLTVAQKLLSRGGYTVLTAEDGASALKVLHDHPSGIDLILLDMTMPGMTTDEIVQGVRALEPSLPILLDSGHTSNEAVKRMIENGSVQGFLSKPYDLHLLTEHVQKLISRD